MGWLGSRGSATAASHIESTVTDVCTCGVCACVQINCAAVCFGPHLVYYHATPMYDMSLHWPNANHTMHSVAVAWAHLSQHCRMHHVMR